MSDAFSLHHGDLFDVLKTLPANSVDSCITDPPYGIRFMGKAWDGADIVAKTNDRAGYSTDADPRSGETGGHRSIAAEAGKYDRSNQANQAFQAWSEAWGREVYRVLKPGAHLVSFASTRTYHRMVSGLEDAGFEIRDQLAWVFGSGFPKSHNLSGDWAGWGTALKPAWEPIVLARKPLVGTVAANVAQFGTGAVHIKACRVGDEGGRWPANLCHDGSPEVVGGFPVEAGAGGPVTTRNADKFRGVYGAFAGNVDEKGSTFQNDSGSAARFFYCAKTSAKDREAGLQDMALQEKTFARSGGAQGAVAAGEGYEAAQTIGLNKVMSRRNIHPTVKPTDLMRWLVRMVTRGGGLVLDPFTGSGSTGRAAILEGCKFVGCEREAEYIPIARARIIEAVGELFA